jgi:hypothetical protein
MSDSHSESSQQHKKKKWVDGWSFPSLSCHASTFFSTATTCLCASLAMVNIVPFTFTGTCIAYIGAQIAKLLCKLTIHRHQCCRCPTNSRAFSVDLSAICHHFDILFFEIRCGTELTCFSAPHAGIYAALPFCILECCSRHMHIGAHAFYLSPFNHSHRTQAIQKTQEMLASTDPSINNDANSTVIVV